jgi:hypothetical protein
MSKKTKSSQSQQRSPLIIAIGIVAMSALVGVYGVWLMTLEKYQASKIVPQSSGEALITGGQGQTTVIVSTPNTNGCQRYELNLDSGKRSEGGPVNCPDGDGKQPSRLETISKTFRNH